MGRISTIKMTILPKVNYLLSMTPVQPTTSWFKSLDSAITKFYWKNKTPRIKLSTLQKPKTLGGLEAPNFTLYCLANHLQYVHKWIHHNQSDITWLDLERTICKDIQISDMPFLTPTIKKHPSFKAPTISSGLSAWWKFHNITNSKHSPSKLSPIWNNPDFTCNKITLNLHSWKDKGITHMQHLLTDGKFSTFADLVQKFGITQKHLLQYLQIKSAIKATVNTAKANLDLPTPVSQLINIPSPKKLLSKIYKIMIQTDTTTSLPSAKWESDLSISTDANFWTQICKNTFLMTKNTNLQLIQYKIIHRTHLTGHKLFRMGFTSDICPHCTQNCPDTYIHALWHCSPITHFWEKITGLLTTFFGCCIPTSPSLCLLGDTTTINLNHFSNTTLLVALAVAKKTILINWKSKNNIHISIWKNLLLDHISLELSNNSTGNNPTWPSLSNFLQS